MNDLFTDGITDISVAGGVVRMSFGVNYMKSKDGQMETRPAFNVMIPIEGFGKMMPGLQQLLEKFVADGVLKARAGGATAKLPSPNFNN